MQTIRLLGILDDGSPRDLLVPHTSAKTISFPLSSDVTVEVEVVNNAGVPVLLASSSPAWNSWFTIVRSPDSCEQAKGETDYQLASTTIKAQTRNVIQFVIPRTALRRFMSGRYFYDVGLYFNGKRYQVVRISGLHLEAALRLP